ncbi:hypothetical protein JOB18_009464 [Solea senegalensis]|uniref:Uncharacterized protein n=1 Tax=Solea senegalensis TaxID=28829 RepID=A0AAV6PV42_SOLSE|nr:hypothetical protein JOB18_009464 [Solea senegalensis]
MDERGGTRTRPLTRAKPPNPPGQVCETVPHGNTVGCEGAGELKWRVWSRGRFVRLCVVAPFGSTLESTHYRVKSRPYDINGVKRDNSNHEQQLWSSAEENY